MNFLLPKDHIVADKFDASAAAETAPTRSIPADRIGLDIGPATRAEYAAQIAKAKTIVWNGPMGVFEIPQFAEGTAGHRQRRRGFVGRFGCGRRRFGRGGEEGGRGAIRSAISPPAAELRWSFSPGSPLPGVAALTEK